MTEASDIAAAAERRTAERYPCPLGEFRPLIVTHGKESRWARLRDVSSTGIGMCVSGPYAPGTQVWLRFYGNADAARLSGEVCHTAQQPDGSWAVGCRLDRPAGGAGPAGERLQALLRTGREAVGR